jgi:hypothetical protein
MKRLVAATLAVALVSPAAWAEPRKMLVLRSEGRADGPTRTRIDAALIKLAKTTDAQVSPGDITMGDAAAAVGCAPDTTACKDEILNMLGVDELVYANAGPKPGGTEVVAYRVARGGVTRDARSMIMRGESPEKLDGLAPLFFASTTATLPPTTSTEPIPPTTTPPGTEPTTPPVATTAVVPPPTSATDPNIAPYPPPTMADQPSRTRLPLAGVITGGAFVLIGFMCWGKAGDLQQQIDDAPANTTTDFNTIRSLERDADSYAGWGNALFLGGAIIGGISAYYLIKSKRDHQRTTTTARVMPAVFDHGAGLTLTIGSTP